MNHYEIKLEYDIPDWGCRHHKELIEAESPLAAIEEVKEWVRDKCYWGDVHWRVACAWHIPVLANQLFFDGIVVTGNGWVSDTFIAVPLENAMWIDEYLFRPVREIDFEERLFSDLGDGEEIVFSHQGKALYGGECAVFVTADGQQIAMAPRYHDFVKNQLHAATWLRCPMKSRPGDCCIVARDTAGQPVAYIMAYRGDDFPAI